MGRSIGIDLGTTNSVVAVVTGDRVETIPNPEGQKTTPSAVLFGRDETVVGELAKRQLVTNPGQVVRSAKRLMGRRFAEVREYADELPFRLLEREEHRAEIQLADGRVVAPERVSAQVLRKMRETAEDFLGESVDSAVITVPAYFNDAQRTATKRAAELADLHVSRIINEPTAAALAFGFRKAEEPRTIAVFDFGGGTFDISIVQLQGDIFEVLSTNGNTHLGGDDIDEAIYAELRQGVLQATGIDPAEDPQAVARLREAAERAKIELSSLSTTHLSLPFIVSDSQGPKHFEREFTRQEFNQLVHPVLDELIPPCRNALADARLKAGEIDEVILVGGSTRIPMVRKIVADFFGREPNRSVNADEAVAIGAAIQAGVMRGELAEILLLDVTPLSLGIELAGGVFKPLIERNSSIPCEATRRYTTVVDNQSSVMVHVLQGERAIAAENRTLARFRLTGIPPMPKELPEIEVTFRIDANGILEVGAMDLTSGVNTGVQMEDYGEFAPLSEEEKQKILADLAAHSKEDQEFLRTANRRARAQHVQALARRIADSEDERVEEEDLKAMKESMLRHDLAVLRGNWDGAESQEEVLDRLIDKYEDILPEHQRRGRGNVPGHLAPGVDPDLVPRYEDVPELEELLRRTERTASGLGEEEEQGTRKSAGDWEPTPDDRDVQEEKPERKESRRAAPPPQGRRTSKASPPANEEDDFDPRKAPPPPPPPD